jgi:uncharacterized protein involved in exopolysaccharide biosynthesis
MTESQQRDRIDDLEPSPPLQFAAFIARHVKLIGVLAASLFVITVLALSVSDDRFASSESFVPQSSSQTSALAGVAAQFGVVAGGSDATQSPAFYADLLKSREVLTTVLRNRFEYTGMNGNVSDSLINLIGVTAQTEPLRTTKALEKLSNMVQVNLKARTGVVSFDVRMPNAVLAQQVAQRFLDEVSRFNQEQRQSRAGAERRFTDGRVVELQRELRDAEDRLQAFLQRNRDYRNSPELSAERDRIIREIDLRQTVFGTVAQSNEKARIDEARDTPVITVVEAPNLPGRPDGRGRLVWGLFALFAGAAAAIVIAYTAEVLEARRLAADPDYIEVHSAATRVGDLARKYFGRARRRRANAGDNAR